MPARGEPAGAAAIPSLDGIRAVAVALVFLAHSGLERIVPGGLGVTIFFVLSGYLITTLMRAEHAASGSVSFRAFYLRRFLRLMPPLAGVVLLAALLSALGLAAGGFSSGGLASVLFYVANYFVIANDFHGVPAGMGVTWSLAVEEHFYLFYPPLALLLLRAASARRSAWVLGSLCAAVLAWRGWLSLHGVTADYIGMATDTRIDAILVGCLMGLVKNPWLDAAAPPRPRRDLLVAAGCVAVLAGTLLYRGDFFRDTLRYTLQSAAIAPLIYLAVARADSRACRWLGAAPLVYLGQISYTVYLCHHLLLLSVSQRWPQLGGLATAVIALGLTLAVAAPMRRWVERPFAQLRRRLHRRGERMAGVAVPHAAVPT